MKKKNYSQKAMSRLYLLAALILPITAAFIIYYILGLENDIQIKYKPIYDIAINIIATGITVLVTMFLMDKANTIRLIHSLSDSFNDPSLPLSRTMRRIFREAISNMDLSVALIVFRHNDHAYEALINDIDDGDIYLVNTIFVTDNPDGKYQTDNKTRKEWINAIKKRITEKEKNITEQRFILSIIEAPEGGANSFITEIGGKDVIKENGGFIFPLAINKEQSQFMMNFVLIKKQIIDLPTEYIVYFGWFLRSPRSTDYPSPCVRIVSEQLYKFLEKSYCYALTATSKKKK